MVEIDDLLAIANREIDSRWSELEAWLKHRFGRDAGLESILFLIGIQSRGSGYVPQLEKEEKQDLVMEGLYVALSEIGLAGSTTDQAPDSLKRPVDLPRLSDGQQQSLLRLGILRYFEQFMDTP